MRRKDIRVPFETMHVGPPSVGWILAIFSALLLALLLAGASQTHSPSPPAPIPTAADYSVAFKSLRDRFDQLKTEVHHESLDLLGTELDQLEREIAFVARVEADLQQTFGQVRQKLREIARV